jgi:hypothetical protein
MEMVERPSAEGLEETGGEAIARLSVAAAGTDCSLAIEARANEASRLAKGFGAWKTGLLRVRMKLFRDRERERWYSAKRSRARCRSANGSCVGFRDGGGGRRTMAKGGGDGRGGGTGAGEEESDL